MFNLVVNYLCALVNILIPCIFLRIVLDAIRNYIFKN